MCVLCFPLPKIDQARDALVLPRGGRSGDKTTAFAFAFPGGIFGCFPLHSPKGILPPFPHPLGCDGGGGDGVTGESLNLNLVGLEEGGKGQGRKGQKAKNKSNAQLRPVTNIA